MRSILLFPVIASCALAGCESSPLPPPTDAAKGRDAMKLVLDTWKRGGGVEELATASVTARDPDWAAGAKLTAYEIAPEEGRAGLDLVLTVKLTLQRSDGKPQNKKVGYTVGVGATTVVLRNE